MVYPEPDKESEICVREIHSLILNSFKHFVTAHFNLTWNPYFHANPKNGLVITSYNISLSSEVSTQWYYSFLKKASICGTSWCAFRQSIYQCPLCQNIWKYNIRIKNNVVPFLLLWINANLGTTAINKIWSFYICNKSQLEKKNQNNGKMLIILLFF